MEQFTHIRPETRQRLRLSSGTELSFVTAGEASKPAVVLLHGFPNSSRMFRQVVPELSRMAYVIAPDLPGFGESDVLPEVSFAAFGQAISELLDRLAIGARYIYLHDWGLLWGSASPCRLPSRCWASSCKMPTRIEPASADVGRDDRLLGDAELLLPGIRCGCVSFG